MKHYKRIATFLLAGCMVLPMTGCSLFTSGDGGQKAEAEEKKTGIEITEKLTHEDPEGLDFDTQQVLDLPEGNGYLAMIKEQHGVEPKNGKIIIYGKEDKPVAYYEYLVMPDEDQAKTYMEKAAAAGGGTISNQGEVTIFEKSKDDVEAELAAYKGMSLIDDESFDSYVGFYEATFEAVKAQ